MLIVNETGVPRGNHSLIVGHWQLSCKPDLNMDSGERGSCQLQCPSPLGCWGTPLVLFPGLEFLSIGKIVLASRMSGCYLDTQTLQKSPHSTTKIFCPEFLEMSISSIIIEYFHLNIISRLLHKDIMSYSNFIFII